MDALDLLSSWPGMSDLTPSQVLAHPAWKMVADFDGVTAALTRATAPVPSLYLAITLDDEPRTLGLADSAAFGDLHLLWPRLAELPEALVIALVERAAGALLQTLENASRKELRIVKLIEDRGQRKGEAGSLAAGESCFRLVAGKREFVYSLDVPRDVVAGMGVLDNLDPAHPSIASLTRKARAEYAVLKLSEAEVAALKAGDFLVADDEETVAAWQVDLPSDDALRLRDVNDAEFTFAQFAAGALPPVPPPKTLAVYRRGAQVATARLARLGDAVGYRVS